MHKPHLLHDDYGTSSTHKTHLIPLPAHRDWPVSPLLRLGCLALCLPQQYQFPDLETTSCGRCNIAVSYVICNTPLFSMKHASGRGFVRLCCIWEGCQERRGSRSGCSHSGRLGGGDRGETAEDGEQNCSPKSRGDRI